MVVIRFISILFGWVCGNADMLLEVLKLTRNESIISIDVVDLSLTLLLSCEVVVYT